MVIDSIPFFCKKVNICCAGITINFRGLLRFKFHFIPKKFLFETKLFSFGKPLDKRKKIMYNTYDLAVNIRE